MNFRDFHGVTQAVEYYDGKTSYDVPVRTAHIISLRRDGACPRFLEGDRGPGVYREFRERWSLLKDGTRAKLNVRSSNVDDPAPQHGFFETGRRFELFDCVTPEFLEDMGLDTPLPGMLHLVDTESLLVYRFRQV